MTTEHDSVGLKEYFLSVVNEREKKYDAKFENTDKALLDSKREVKEALTVVSTAQRDALATANDLTKGVLASANAITKALGDSVDLRFQAADKSVAKTELGMEKRFEDGNRYREQLAEQQVTFARKAEVDLRFDALEKKLEAATGMTKIVTISFGIITLIMGIIALIIILHPFK